MIDLPDSYRVEKTGKRLNLKHFAPASLGTADRRRVRNCLKKAVLTHQIAGEAIPSLVTKHYNCSAILFLDIEIADIRQKDFVGNTVQRLMKPLCVSHLFDAAGNHALSFARKRLSLQDEEEIVIEGSYCTAALSDLSSMATLRFESLVNRENKRDLYLEAMTKAFLADHPNVFIGAEEMLRQAKLWYHGESIYRLFQQLTEIHALKREKEQANSGAAKAALNKRIKEAIDGAKNQLHPKPVQP